MKFSFPILFFLIAINQCNSQTYISGGIFSNTTWAQADNPYIVNGKTVVFEGVTLTIEPGVIVKFDSNIGLELRGKLVAIGTPSDNITFTSNSASPTESDWNGIKVKGTSKPIGVDNQVIMEYCIGEYAHYFIDLNKAYHGPYVFKNCYFAHNYQTNHDGGLPITIFEKCTFEYNHTALGPCQFDSKVINCIFKNNVDGVDGINIVDTCYFTGHSGVALSPYGSTKGCTIENNYIGVKCYFNSENNSFVNNTVIDNEIGVQILSYFNGSVVFNGNTICSNDLNNIELLHHNNANLSDNCWCSSDSITIRSSIFDGHDDTNYGLVGFIPWSDDCSEISVNVKDQSTGFLAAKIFPNPFNSNLNIATEKKESITVSIYSSNGILIFTRTFSERINIDTSNFPSGSYFYQLQGPKGVYQQGRLLKI